ncbi:hypothetical protein Esi_0394_0016 [Ectocarpus siliculosus]|uniref:Uncharacterized protein n=1 Tax=Ectocarpus siliculosus TaxID=2880 RepID=D7G060_ECTSI|nr:hypothetical protein Esi_0394_0016 [Ectocarpus siliculosus]|eukprot:CBJ32942.1 hypothetical protein Esi_0394_0016 [Ectocarpus siliculosus]
MMVDDGTTINGIMIDAPEQDNSGDPAGFPATWHGPPCSADEARSGVSHKKPSRRHIPS